MRPKTAALTLIVLFYLATGRVCFSTEPWGQPTPEAKWAQPIQRDDPRPFWVRLLLSLRWDFHKKELTGGTTF